MGNGTSIGRVRGLGSSHHGAHHWLVQRITAVGNLVTVLFFGISMALLPNHTYGTVTDWIGQPVAATMMALMVITTFWHARLGLQVLIEDYLHESGTRFGAVLALNLASFAGTVFGLFCIARLALGSVALGGAA